MKTRLTLEEHREFGELLKECREELLQWYCKVGSHYPQQSKATVYAHQAVKALDKLKCEMDNRVCAEHHELEDQDVTGIYYGLSKQWQARERAKAEAAQGLRQRAALNLKSGKARSQCCNGTVSVDGDQLEGTLYYECNTCGKACDLA